MLTYWNKGHMACGRPPQKKKHNRDVGCGALKLIWSRTLCCCPLKTTFFIVLPPPNATMMMQSVPLYERNSKFEGTPLALLFSVKLMTPLNHLKFNDLINWCWSSGLELSIFVLFSFFRRQSPTWLIKCC